MKRFGWRLWLPVCLSLLILGVWVAFHTLARTPEYRAATDIFLVEPYLQLGDAGDVHHPHVVFASTDKTIKWAVEAKIGNSPGWTAATGISSQPVQLANMPAFQLFDAALPEVPADAQAVYRLTANGKPVYSAPITPPKKPNEHYRVDVVGDIGADNAMENTIAHLIYSSKPDLVAVPGDIVYAHGRSREYLHHFFPVYNAPAAGPQGVPLLRSTIFVAAPGNHDTSWGSRYNSGDLSTVPDGLGFFLWWHQPLNGPKGEQLGANHPEPRGMQPDKEGFLNAAGNRFPQGINFSFDYANSHWTVIDADNYMDWTNAGLRDWLIKDLDSAKNSTFKFVVFHQPPFNSAEHHFQDQQMRLISDILQEHGVDIAFGGHVHGYQRTFPLKFTARKTAGQWRTPEGFVNGDFKVDRQFDGKQDTHPQGVIYIVTAGGGAHLYNPEGQTTPDIAQPFTDKFAARHGFSQCDIEGGHLEFKQIAENGAVIDQFSIDKETAARPPH